MGASSTVKRQAMKFNEAISILKLLGTRQEDAMTIQQIITKWDLVHAEKLHLRTAQRYLSELSADGADGTALVQVDTASKERKYHLRLSEMANWFMTEESALYQVLSLQVLQSTFGEAAATVIERQMDAAEHLTQTQLRTKRLRERVRIVSDGVGRLRTKISKAVLASVMDALAGDQKILIEYRSARGNSSSLELNPLGLVAKDGTLYLLAIKGLDDKIIHYALQRIQSAMVRPFRAQGRDGFLLDEYIRASHQLSHALDQKLEPVKLKLKVKPESVYHFEERPLSENQKVEKASQLNEWAIVTAEVPLSLLLTHFLLSMGSAVEVLEPDKLRDAISQQLSDAASLYAK